MLALVLDVLQRDDAPPLVRVAGEARETHDRGLEARERARVALLERGREVGQRGVGAVGERQRLLELEGDRDAPVVGAVVVLDRYEIEEANELGRAASLLVGRERCRAEVLQRGTGVLQSLSEGGRPLDERGQALECGVHLGAGGRPPLVLVDGREMRQ